MSFLKNALQTAPSTERTAFVTVKLSTEENTRMSFLQSKLSSIKKPKIINSDYTAKDGDQLLLDVTTAGFNLTLDPNAAINSEIVLQHALGNIKDNPVTVIGKVRSIQNFQFKSNWSRMEFIKVGGGTGWLITVT